MLLRASMTLESSPPDATLESGFGGSPGFAENKNSTLSMPVEATGTSFVSILNSALLKASSRSSFITSSSIFLAVIILFSERASAAFISLSSFSLSSASIKSSLSSVSSSTLSSFSASPL